MFFCEGKFFAKVWSIKKEEKYLDLRISTNEKDQDGEWHDSTWFTRVIGHAFNSLKDTLKEGDNIVINRIKFSNEGEKGDDGKWKSYFKVLILDASISEKAEKKSTENTGSTKAEKEDKEDSPW